jgi:hypothetical protein
LAKVLHQEDLDGFGGYSLNDCECHFLCPVPFLLLSYSCPGPSFFLTHSSFRAKFKRIPTPKKPFQHSVVIQQSLTEHLLCPKNCFSLWGCSSFVIVFISRGEGSSSTTTTHTHTHNHTKI